MSGRNSAIFTTAEIGYIVASNGRTMSQEGQIIFKTTSGGESRAECGYGPSTALFRDAFFPQKNLGFLAYYYVQGQETNPYRTQDGGNSFAPVILPIKEEWKEIFIEPQAPK